MHKPISEAQKEIRDDERVRRGMWPWWAVMAVAQNSVVKEFLNAYNHFHHCAECGSIMSCQYVGCKDPEARCSSCAAKKSRAKGNHSSDYHLG